MEDKPTYKPPSQVWIILLYSLFCAILVLVGFLMTSQILPLIENFGAAKEPLWIMGLWGSLGAIISALYALSKHTTLYKDYERAYAIWYFTAPLEGFIMGVFSGIVFVNMLPYMFPGNTPRLGDTSPYLLWLMAWLAGFHRRAIVHWLGQVVRRTFSVKDK